MQLRRLTMRDSQCHSPVLKPAGSRPRKSWCFSLKIDKSIGLSVLCLWRTLTDTLGVIFFLILLLPAKITLGKDWFCASSLDFS